VNNRPLLTWDTLDVIESQVELLREEHPDRDDDALFQMAAEDGDLLDFEWDDLCDALTEAMGEINPDGLWYAAVSNFGWRHLSGTKTFRACTGRELLRCVLPQTECSFKIYRDGDLLQIDNAHHDAPTGGEWYSIVPAGVAEALGIGCEF
jgi:hypothetical protein